MAESINSQNADFEGKAIQLFRVRMRGIVEQIVDGISAERFAEIYGDIVKEKQARRLLKIWQENVLKYIVQELDEIIVEEKLNEKSKELADIIEQNQLDSNTVAWRPPGKPTQHMRSLDMLEKLKIKKEWEEFVSEKEALVDQLMKEVEAGREETLELDKKLQAEIMTLKKQNEIFKSIESNRVACLEQLIQEE